MRGGDRGDGVVVGRQAEQIDRDDGARLEAEAFCRLDRAGAACGVDVEGVGIDVGEDRRGAAERDDFGGGAEGEGRTDHGVARADLPGHQSQAQRIGAARAGDRVARAAERRELGLERAHFRTLDELAMRQDAARPRRRPRGRAGGVARRRR